MVGCLGGSISNEDEISLVLNLVVWRVEEGSKSDVSEAWRERYFVLGRPQTSLTDTHYAMRSVVAVGKALWHQLNCEAGDEGKLEGEMIETHTKEKKLVE